MLMSLKKKYDEKKYKRKIKELKKSVEYMYDCYQDIGKKYFDLSEKVDKLKSYIEKENIEDKCMIRYLERMHKNCMDESYRKSYKGTIWAANAVISERLAILKRL